MMKFFRFFFATLLVTMSYPALAVERPSPVAVEAILFDKAADAEHVRIRLTGRVEPIIFQLPGAKPRVVCDLPAVAYPPAMKKVHAVAGDLIRRIRVGVHHQPEPKTRIVIDLVRQGEYTVAHEYDVADASLNIRIAPKTTKMKPELVPDDGDGIEEEFKVLGEDEAVPQAPKPATAPVTPGEADAEPVAEPAPKPEESEEPEEPKELEELEEPEEPAASLIPQQEESAKEPVFQEQKRVLRFGAEQEQGDKADEENLPVLLDVSYESGSRDKEMVLFRLSGFYPPVVFSTEGDNLLVVCDFLDAMLAYGIDPVLQTEGKYIQQVRTEKRSDPEKVRVVLDLAKGYNYDVKQVFFKDDNLFVVVISSLGEKEQSP